MSFVNKKLKRVIAIMITIITILSAMPISSFAKFITDMNSNAEFGVISNSKNTYGHEMHYAIYDSKKYIIFCTQYGKNSPSGKEYKYEDDFLVEYKNDRKSYREIAEYIYFGYTMKYGTGLPTETDEKKAACCVQQFVWEYIEDNINDSYGSPSRNSWNSTYMSSSIYRNWLEETEEYYNKYHSDGVSFNGKTKKIDIGETQTFNDTNKVLEDYPSFTQIVDGVKFKHTKGSNDLIVTVEESTDATKVKFRSDKFDLFRLMPDGSEYDSEKNSNYIYFKFKGEVQNLIFSNYVDPDYFSITIGIESGDVLLKKTNKNGDTLAGCKFSIYEDEECTEKVATATTDKDGKILFDSLSTGDFWIKEISVPQRIFVRHYNKKSYC